MRFGLLKQRRGDAQHLYAVLVLLLLRLPRSLRALGLNVGDGLRLIPVAIGFASSNLILGRGEYCRRRRHQSDRA